MSLEILSLLTAGSPDIYSQRPSALQHIAIDRLQHQLRGHRQPKVYAHAQDDSGHRHATLREDIIGAMAGLTDTETDIVLCLHCDDPGARARLTDDLTRRMAGLLGDWEIPDRLDGIPICSWFAAIALQECMFRPVSDRGKARLLGLDKDWYRRNLKRIYETGKKMISDLISKAEAKAEVRLRRMR